MLRSRLSFLRSLRKLLFARNLPRPRPASPLARRALLCEQLEDRTVPSGLVDPLASVVSFAAPLDASGTTDLVTIAVADTDGRPISDLTGSDFALGLSGGTSTGTFGPVSEIGTSGTYYALFTGNTAGTPDNLTVSVDGIQLSSQPTVQVTPGAVSASNSTATFSTSGVPGVTADHLMIGVKDAAGNVITGLASSAFRLSGGTGAGTFGPVTEIGTSGTYYALFADPGVVAGVHYAPIITVDGVLLDSRPTFFFPRADGSSGDPPPPGGFPGRGGVVIGGGESSSSGGTSIPQIAPTVSFASRTDASGAADLVTIVVGKTDGTFISGLADRDFTFSLSGGTSTGAFGPVTQTATPGTYTTNFTGRTAGTPLTLTVSVGGIPAINQPTIQVTPGTVSGANSTANFATPSVSAGAKEVVTISVKDAAGNAITTLGDAAFRLALSGGTSAGTFGPLAEIGTSGVYTATFTGTQGGTPSALAVAVTGVSLTTQPAVRVTPAPPAPAPAATAPAAPPAPPAAEPVFSGAFMFGNLMVLAGSGFPGGFAVIPLPPGSFALFADANGDGHGDVVLLVPHTIFVLDGLTGSALAVPF